MTLSPTSSACAEGGEIPTLYICEGAGTFRRRLPGRNHPVHPPTAGGLPEALAPNTPPAGMRVGLNDWKWTSYRGPCPPIGRRRY
jgi:hypothetical protein